MDTQGFNRVEQLCAVLYGASSRPVSQEERDQAHKTLLTLQTSAHFLPQLKYLLENSKTDYTIMFAARSLVEVVTRDWRNIQPAQRIGLVQFILQKLAARGNTQYITRSLIQVVCRITKLGWCIDEKHRNIFQDIVQFLQAGGEHAILGLQILSELVTEFDHGQSGRGGRLDSQGRQAAQSFREQDGLTRAFKLALELVQRSHQNNDRVVLREALHTLHACLVYDFVGTGHDESDDVVSCLYIPLEWAEHVARARAVNLFFTIYQAQWHVQDASQIDASENSAASVCLQCIVLLVAVRRSVFDPASRQEFLVALLEGTTVLMREKTGLSHSEACLHHLCRLLARIKNHFQLVDLTRPPQYRPWLEEFAGFTEGVLSAWKSVSVRSVHYLMRLWASLVLPTPYLQVRDGYKIMPTAGSSSMSGNMQSINDKNNGKPSYLQGLDVFVPNVVRAFVSTRADMCASAAVAALDEDGDNDDLEDVSGFGSFGQGMGGIEDDPLDSEGMLLEQLTPLSVLTRFRYGASAEGIANLYNDALNKRGQALVAMTNAQHSGGPTNAVNEAKRALVESQARLAFLTYLIGAIVGGHVSRVSASVIERLDELNAELAALVFRMVIATQNAEDTFASQGQGGSAAMMLFGFRSDAGWKLELASLYFFRCFQNLYIESRARDDAEQQQRSKRTLNLIEDMNGFLNLTWSNNSGSKSNMSSQTSSGPRSNPPVFRMHALPTAVPSLESITSGGIIGFTSATKRDEADKKDTNDDTTMQTNSGTPCPSPVVGDKEMTDEQTNRASNIQRGIAAILGVTGGDRTLLDIAMRRIFGLLQHAQQSSQMQANQGGGTGSSAPVILVERALSVLYQLSVGVTVVHAGRSYTPRLMSSGRLLLESEVIQDLLRNPDAKRFPLLLEPKHGRSRTFLSSTLAKLLFTQIRYPNSKSGMASDSDRSGSVIVVGKSIDGNLTIQSRDGKQSRQEAGEDQFITYMHPLTETTDALLQVLRRGESLRQDQFKTALIGLFRDLRGLMNSAGVSREYELVFAWLTPDRIRLLSAVAASWHDINDVMIPLLKLLSEIVYNRGSRIIFPPLSVGGLVLFKEGASVLIAYCESQLKFIYQMRDKQGQSRDQMIATTVNNENTLRDLSMITGANVDGSTSDPLSMTALREAVMAMGEEMGREAEKTGGKDKSGIIELAPGAVGIGITLDIDTKLMKCARICVVCMNRMLGGRYAQLGTFELYQDNCLIGSRRAVLELALASAPTHVMSFPKMARALVILLNLLADKFISGIVNLPSPLFARLIACLAEAVASPVSTLSTPAASAIEYIAVFRCRAAAAGASSNQMTAPVLNPEHRTRGERIKAQDLADAAQYFAAHDSAQPKLFGDILVLLLDKLMSASGSSLTNNQWTLARPVLPLILCAPDAFVNFRQQFLTAQSPSREPTVRKFFDKLFSMLTPAITINGATGPNPVHFESMLQMNDSFTKDLCGFCREIRQL